MKKNKLQVIVGGLIGLSAGVVGKEVEAGGGGEGSSGGDYAAGVNAGIGIGGRAAANGFAAGQYNTSYSYKGAEYGVSVNPNGSVTVSSVNGSTPFLLTKQGTTFIHENDFLFGKPQTAFATYEQGLAAYQAGIGGDVYRIQNTITPDTDGTISLQIRELEPEESFIDQFTINALDLKAEEHFISNGNLNDSYVFNTKEAIIPAAQTLNHFHTRYHVFSTVTPGYHSLVPQPGTDITLEKNDELILTIPKANLNPDTDTFILVDSHFRDWNLGGSAPFSFLEQFQISSLALGRTLITTTAGVALIAAALLGTNQTPQQLLAKLITVPYTYADVPAPSGGGGGGGGGSGGSFGGGPSGRSLVISAGDSTTQTYLETLFPRYVQASQEVVRIPKEIIKSLKDTALTVRIKATKKHKVKTAFIFQGTPTTPTFTPLSLTKAFHRREGKDYATTLTTKNHTFLHTIPGDVVDVTLKDVPRTPHTIRHYVLTAHGFYTKLAPATAAFIGPRWLSRLLPEDRKLLRGLKGNAA